MKKKEQIAKKIVLKSRAKISLRDKPITFSLNETEYKVLQKYCAKYKITNRARLIRETLIKSILNKMNEDYPTLFGENEMR